MGRGVSCGGGQSSLGYLFGSGEEPKPAAANNAAAPAPNPADANIAAAPAPKPDAADNAAAPAPMAATSPLADQNKQTAAGVPGNQTNNYFRADGQNTGNFLTDRPSTKVHSAPGGGSSLGYLFGNGDK